MIPVIVRDVVDLNGNEIHFEVSDEVVVTHKVAQEALRHYQVDPSVRTIAAIPIDIQSSLPQSVLWLIDNQYRPLVRNNQVVFIPFNDAAPVEEEVLFDDRETRSSYFVAGPMNIVGFDKKSMMMELKFSSPQDYQKFLRTAAKSQAAIGNFALANRFKVDAGGFEDANSLKWMQRALDVTADHVRKVDVERAVEYDIHAQKVSDAQQKKVEEFNKAINKMREALKPGSYDLELLIKNFWRARSANPESFKPYFFILMIFPALSNSFPDLCEQVLNDAYTLSPIDTFNVLFLLQLFGNTKSPDEQASRQAFCQLFAKRFPKDFLVFRCLSVSHEAVYLPKSNRLQEKYKQHLCGALNFIRSKSFPAAREQFTLAGHCNVSDKRPYYYKAVLDLKEGDFSSALKLILQLATRVDWHSEIAKFEATQQLLSIIQDPASPGWKPKTPEEIPVLKCLLKVYQKEGETPLENQRLLDALKEYLSNSEADLLWAGLVVDCLKELLANKEDLERKHIPFLIELYLLLPCRSYLQLMHEEEDLPDYEDKFTRDEEGHLCVSPVWILISSERTEEPIAIDFETLEPTQSSRPKLMKEILGKSYNEFSLFFLRIGGEIDNLLTALEGFKIEKGDFLYSPMLAVLIERIDLEGTLSQQVRFIEWARLHHANMTDNCQKLLTNSIYRCQLKQLIKTAEFEPFTLVQTHWLQVMHCEPMKNELWIAVQAWSAIEKKQWNDAVAVIEPFIANWEERMNGDVDFIALNMICACLALLDNRELAQEIPLLAASSLHAELIRSALMMLAREKVKWPYVIPNVNLSRQRIQQLCLLYVGQRRGEQEEAYLKRLKAKQINHLSDLRQTKRISKFGEENPEEKNWLLPLLRPRLIQEMRECVELEIAFCEAANEKNGNIRNEAPSYTQDAPFIQWVTDNNPDQVQAFLKNPQQFKADLNQRFPNLPKKVKETYIKDLGEKAKHFRDFAALKNKTDAVNKKPGQRFWQLVSQVEALIKIIKTTDRAEQRYDIWVADHQEAHFVMKLIFEWTRQEWKEITPEGAADYFHGPEAHIWGEGPRIPHYNAGVYIKGESKPKNVHIFYG